MKNKKFYTITNDIVFKLSLQNNIRALHKLCTVFIKDFKDDTFKPEEIIIENPELPGIEIKNSIMDIKFQIVNKYSFDLEMQEFEPSYALENRIVKYHTELIVRSYPKSEDYRHLMCYSLWFIDFDYFKGDNPIHTFTLNERGTNNSNHGFGSITVVEIKKLKNYNKNNVWYKLFTENDYSKLKGEDDIMDSLVDDIESINENDSLSYLVSDRYRALIETNALNRGYMEKGLQQGLEQGLEQGKKEKAVQIALKLKSRGMSIEDIIDITGLTKEEVESL